MLRYLKGTASCKLADSESLLHSRSACWRSLLFFAYCPAAITTYLDKGISRSNSAHGCCSEGDGGGERWDANSQSHSTLFAYPSECMILTVQEAAKEAFLKSQEDDYFQKCLLHDSWCQAQCNLEGLLAVQAAPIDARSIVSICDDFKIAIAQSLTGASCNGVLIMYVSSYCSATSQY